MFLFKKWPSFAFPSCVTFIFFNSEVLRRRRHILISEVKWWCDADVFVYSLVSCLGGRNNRYILFFYFYEFTDWLHLEWFPLRKKNAEFVIRELGKCLFNCFFVDEFLLISKEINKIERKKLNLISKVDFEARINYKRTCRHHHFS